METANIELSKNELSHIINDLTAYIWRIKEQVFGHYNFGTDISEVKRISDEQEKKLIAYGYYSRKELLDKLKKIECEKFSHNECCGG